MTDQTITNNNSVATQTSNIPFEVQVMVQPTPNPNAYKFIVNREVKAKGRITYNAAEECVNNELGRALFDVLGVTQLHFFENVITVTFLQGVDILAAEDQVIAVIKQKILSHDPDFVAEEDEESRRESLDPELRRIEEILDRTIRPGLQGDGGDIEVVSLIDNELSIRYQGACGSCPSSTQGTLMALEGILRDEYDPDICVVPV